MNNFNGIAPFYDAMAFAVFGKQIKKSQVHFLYRIADGSEVLILGGGTGWLLRELLQAKPHCKIWNVEASAKMLALSKEKVSHRASVVFIHGTQDTLPSDKKFDVIITNFLFDLFETESLKKVMTKTKSHLKNDGAWLVSDFIASRKRMHRALLKIMYLFFRTASNIEATTLPDWQKLVCDQGMHEQDHKFFYNGFIKSICYFPAT